MKNIFLAILACMAFSGAYAQQGIHIGVGGAPLNTWILNSEDSDAARDTFAYEFTLGYAGMFKLGYNFADPIGIHVGAIYSKQGQKSESVDSIGGELRTIQTKRDLRYLKIPILLHINSNPAPAMFRMEIGPQIGLLLDADYWRNNTPVTSSFDPEELFETNTLSFTWALGAQFQISKIVGFYLEHRGDYSIGDIENKSFTFNGLPFYDANRPGSSNLTLGIFAGFEFCFLPKGGGGQYWIR